ncbi:MAG TPA: type II toxin-antitoxin system VapC family toxin [Thermomicrobiales bacterium]
MSDRVVVDASLAVKWVLREVHTPEAVYLLTEWEQRRVRRLAPTWFLAEVANVRYKGVRRQTVTIPVARLAIRRISQAVILRPIGPRLAERAIELADLMGQPASYEAQYLTLAERVGCEFWTADERLWNSVKTVLPWVRWVGQVTLPATASSGQPVT